MFVYYVSLWITDARIFVYNIDGTMCNLLNNMTVINLLIVLAICVVNAGDSQCIGQQRLP